MTRQEVRGNALWYGNELLQRHDWEHFLNQVHVAELEHALLEVRHLQPEAIKLEDFPLSTTAAFFAEIRENLERGSGAARILGLPHDRYDEQDLARLFIGMSRHLGTTVSQASSGQHLFRVQDEGFGDQHAKARGPNTSKPLRFHCDRCDVIAFLCVRQAQEGGENQLVSALALHNEILRRRPDLLDVLYQPFYYKRHNVDLANEKPWCRQPVFAIEQGHFVGYVLRELIERAYQMSELPDMTEPQREALDLLDAVAAEPDFHVTFRQHPGEILLVNNFSIFHRRKGFSDPPDAVERRLLYRLWLAMPNSRPLPALFADNFGQTAAGAIRGGIHPK